MLSDQEPSSVASGIAKIQELGGDQRDHFIPREAGLESGAICLPSPCSPDVGAGRMLQDGGVALEFSQIHVAGAREIGGPGTLWPTACGWFRTVNWPQQHGPGSSPLFLQSQSSPPIEGSTSAPSLQQEHLQNGLFPGRGRGGKSSLTLPRRLAVTWTYFT